MPELESQQIVNFRMLLNSGMILKLLNSLGRPASAGEVGQLLGITAKTARRYLWDLEMLGYVIHLEESATFQAVAILEDLLAGEGEGKTFSTPAAVNTAVINTDININSINNKTEAESVVGLRAKMAENYAAQAAGAIRAGPPNGEMRAEFRAILRALARAGIGEPKRSELARLPHMSVRLVQDWQAELVESRGNKYTTGLLVHVLQLGEPPPGKDYPELLLCPELQHRPEPIRS